MERGGQTSGSDSVPTPRRVYLRRTPGDQSTSAIERTWHMSDSLDRNPDIASRQKCLNPFKLVPFRKGAFMSGDGDRSTLPEKHYNSGRDLRGTPGDQRRSSSQAPGHGEQRSGSDSHPWRSEGDHVRRWWSQSRSSRVSLGHEQEKKSNRHVPDTPWDERALDGVARSTSGLVILRPDHIGQSYRVLLRNGIRGVDAGRRVRSERGSCQIVRLLHVSSLVRKE